MAVNVIAATAPTLATGTSITASLPSSLLAGDLILAVVTETAADTPTPPAGFTFFHEVTCSGGGVTQRTNLYEFWPAPADSGASVTFTPAASATMAVFFVHLRSDSGRGIKRGDTSNNSFSNVTNGAAFIFGYSNLNFDVGRVIAIMSQTVPLVASTAPPTEAGLTALFGAQANMRVWGYYSTAYYEYGSIGFEGRYSPVTNTATNGPAAIRVVYTDKKGPGDLGDDVEILPNAKQALAYDLTAGGGVDSALSRVMAYALGDRIGLAGVGSDDTKFYRTFEDRAQIADALLRSLPSALAESIGLTSTLQSIRALTVIEQLGISETTTRATQYHNMLEDRVRIVDEMRRFFGASLSDGAGIAEALAQHKVVIQQLAQGLGVTETVGPKLLLRATLQDVATLDDSQLLSMIFSGQLSDDVEITSAYLSPDGNFTTWAINAKSGAISEYTNYNFNSFAELARGRYVAAADDGLYELHGDTDDGADIIAKIKSGLAQINGSRFTGFKGAYLGLRGDGVYLLKLDTGDGKSYVYQIEADSMMTTKVNIGKGVRARYISFELTTQGQDFDLDTVEFVPTQVFRRV